MLKRILSPPLIVALAAMCSGCIPADPEQAPIGVRVDSSTVSVLIPRCSTEKVVSAEIVEMTADVTPPVWTATGFGGDLSHGIRLNGEDWSSVKGKYLGLASIGITVNTDRWSYGTVLMDPKAWAAAEAAPEGSFLVDGTSMTPEKYQADVVSRFPCPKESS